MTTHDREQRDCGRLRRWCAVLRSRPVLRIAVLTGFSGIAWLAGVAGAQAEPAADAAPDSSSQHSAVAPVPGDVPAESEQAALSPANQLESSTSSILDAPSQMLSPSKPDSARAANGADTSADVAASEPVDSEPSTSEGESRPDAPTVVEPLASTVSPVTDQLTEHVDSALTDVTRPVKASSHPVDSVLTTLDSTADAPALPSLKSSNQDDNSGIDVGTPFDVYDGEGLAKPQHDVAGETADSVHTVWSEVKGESIVSDTLPRHDERAPFSDPVNPDLGYTKTGAVPSGISSHGPAPADSGTESPDSAFTARAATVSRVAPSTAAYGQLPDHIADPAVSPD